MKKIDKYEICGLLGKGGMGMVYKVRMPVVGKVVALKRLVPHPFLVGVLGQEEIKRRFVAEALTMARLRHPHIVAIWDFHDQDDLTFFIMEYFCNNLGVVIGETYRVERPSRILRVDKAIDYTQQILRGLHRLHQAGIVHRDIKPYNILITDQNTVKITDFGLSKLRGETLRGPKNLMVGSPYYAAPEQEKDPNQVDVRADLYPVGITLYRMLTGELPIDSIKPVGQINPDLDSHWDDFLAKAMAADRNARFSSAEEMLIALNRLQKGWEEKKDKVCQWPGNSLPKDDPLSGAEQGFRNYSIKVRPRKAQDVFKTDNRWRPVTYVTNAYRANQDGTVTDRATGLIWQQAGSDYPVTWQEAHDYIEMLNHKGFAGHDDWRLPTVDELITLLTDVPQAGDLCIEPVFNQNERWLWSCDRRSYVAAWYVSVDLGYVSWQDFSCYYYVRAVREGREAGPK
jgi:serine/threonine-protein kinase